MGAELTAGEIKAIRQQYGLSQRAFALLLGIGQASIVRYEQGSRPSKANANLIRAARHPEFMMECLEEDGDLLPEAQCDQARRVVYALISLNEDEPVIVGSAHRAPAPGQRMNEAYELTLRQEVLNEQAANIMGGIISAKVTSGFQGTVSGVFDVLLDQVSHVKRTILDVKSHAQLGEIEGYLSCAQELLQKHLQKVA